MYPCASNSWVQRLFAVILWSIRVIYDMMRQVILFFFPFPYTNQCSLRNIPLCFFHQYKKSKSVASYPKTPRYSIQQRYTGGGLCLCGFIEPWVLLSLDFNYCFRLSKNSKADQRSRRNINLCSIKTYVQEAFPVIQKLLEADVFISTSVIKCILIWVQRAVFY